MAPLPSSLLSARHVNPSSISDLSISSLELDRRSSPPDLPTYLSTLPLSDRERLDAPSTTRTSLLSKRATVLSPLDAGALSPLDAGALLRARDPSRDSSGYSRGAGAIPPDAINNKGVLALFGLLSASLVFASIWFFFWAKNGGFVWRKGDWEDYKSTVLRRKGPDGKTLSNATKRTVLGGGSVVGGSMGTYEDESALDVEEGKQKSKAGKGKAKGKKTRAGGGGKGGRDEDVRAYRHEKPARVGGLNRQPDGSYHDYSNTEPSELAPSTYAFVVPPAGRRETVKDKDRNKDKDKNHPPHPSYTVGSEESFSVLSASTASDRRPLRSSPHHHRHHRSEHGSPSPAHTPTASRSRQSSPRKQHPPHRRSASQSRRSGRYTEPIDFESRYSASEVETVESGTKSYFHPIPELSGGRAAGAVEKKGLGGDAGGGGFRRGTGGRARRDSLSDSEAETDAYTVRS